MTGAGTAPLLGQVVVRQVPSMPTLPVGIETRADFIERLAKATAWLNRNKKAELWHLATNQKERCRACLAMNPPGGRTKW